MALNDLKAMLIGAADSVSRNRESINRVNVFPIPDGDTGTNMNKTLGGIIKCLIEIGDKDLEEEDFDLLYNGALMASQGNSGVILSQWFKGFFASLKENMELNAATLDEAFIYASEAAYNSVSNPTEGTILTVAREANEGAEESATEDTSLTEYLNEALRCAKISLENTPNLLPVLKEAGVIDSGGLGFVYMLGGMIEGLNGECKVTIDDLLKKHGSIKGALQTMADPEEFGYCTEIILTIDESKRDIFKFMDEKRWCESVGTSVVAVMNKNQFKVHVHTMEPEQILSHFHSFGEFYKIKIENMTVQHNELPLEYEIASKREGCSVIAVADGKGIEKLFLEMGVTKVIGGGQSDNVSVADMIAAINECGTKEVILLPNNKNIFMAANQARDNVTDVNVVIIPTMSMGDAYIALSLASFDGCADDIAKEMNDALEGGVSLQIAAAARDSVCDGIEVKNGQQLLISDGKVVAAKDELSGLLGILGDIVADACDRESLVVFCKNAYYMSMIKESESMLKDTFRNAEVYFFNGGQTVYDYVFAIM